MVNHWVRVNSIQGSNWYSDSQPPLVRHFRPEQAGAIEENARTNGVYQLC